MSNTITSPFLSPAGRKIERSRKVVKFKGLSKENFTITTNIPADNLSTRDDIDWDISHARRLVHALDALERNRSAINVIFLLTDKLLPPDYLTTLFANTIVKVIWNGDKEQPLFANYWCGANGWYRVAYDNGTGRCMEGYPPMA